jgi:cell wall-associated NlpC family hydrolase
MTRRCRTLFAAALAVGLVVMAADPALAAPKSAAGTSTYVVQPGDSLFGIAVKVNVKVGELLAINKLVTSSLIVPGEVLTIPVGGRNIAVAPAPSASLVYTVLKNDYITGISAKLQVSTRDLLVANHLQLNSLIWPGMQLVVPAGGVLPTPPVKPSVASSSSSTSSSSTSTTSTAPAPKTLLYAIVRGDSLSGIADKLKVRLGSLLAINQLTVTSVIHPGMNLVVPAGGVLPTPATPPTTSTSTSSSTTSTVPTASKVSSNAPVPAKVTAVLNWVRSQEGKPYKAFMAGPDSYDCSGLTMAGYQQIGLNLPHYSGAQISFGTAVDWTTQPIRPGDLVFLESAPGSGIVSHVGIAISATMWIHAPRTGDVVREGNIPMGRVVGVRRLVNG